MRLGTCVVLCLATLVFAVAMVCGPPTALCETTGLPPIAVTAAYANGEPEPPELTSKAALVIDTDSGEIVFTKNADERLAMASTTKIMTAILVLDSLDLDTEVVISRNAHFQSGSVVGLNTLDKVTVEQLLYWLLVLSGNDAAVALAEATSGNVTAFVEKMNEKAEEMGLTNTHFNSANGLDTTDHYSSCTDLAAMARYAMQDETFRKIVKTTTYDLPHPSVDAAEEPHSSNALLTKYDWITGVKTGSTPKAGDCMVASGTRDDVSLMVVLLGAEDSDTRWAEVEALFRYGFGLRPATVLTQPGQVLATVPLNDPLEHSVELVPKDRLAIRVAAGKTAMGVITITHGTLPIQAGDVLGSIEFTMNGKSLGTTDLSARGPVSVPTVRSMLVRARNWHLPEFQLSDSGERYAH